MLAIESYPLPPSENESYGTNFKSRRRFKTEVYEDFESQVFLWSMKNRGTVSHLKSNFKEWTAKPLGVVRIDFIFTFHHPRIVTKAGKLKSKKCDPLNYVKPVADTLSKLVSVDDSFFEAGLVVKAFTTTKYCEGVYLQFSPSKVMLREDAKLLLTNQML